MALSSGRMTLQMTLPSLRPPAQVALSSLRPLSQAVAPPASVRLSANMRLLTYSEAARPAAGVPALHVLRHTADRPLAILLPWLGATDGSLSRYARFYLSQGFNVLVNTVTARQLLLPETGTQEVARQLVDLLLTHEDVRQYVVHGFSVGAYYWGEVLGQMRWMDPARTVSKKVAGTVFDSPADFHEISVGLPLAVTDNRLLQKLIAAYARLHLRLLEDKATRHYREARRLFVQYPLDSPIMFLWAQNDPVTCCAAINQMISQFRQRGRPVFAQCWSESRHVRHLTLHPAEYHSLMGAFLESVGLLRYPDQFPAVRRATQSV